VGVGAFALNQALTPRPWAGAELEDRQAAPVLRFLDLPDLQINLSRFGAPEGFAEEGVRIPVTVGPMKRGGVGVLLPFESGDDPSALAGMRVWDKDKEIAFSPTPLVTSRTWRVVDNKLMVSGLSGGNELTIHHTGLSHLYDSLVYADGDPVDFARRTVTVAGQTRAGALLGPGGQIRAPLLIPPGGQIQASLTLLAAPLQSAVTDGGAVKVRVIEGDTVTEVARVDIVAVDQWVPLDADLSPWAGKNVLVELVADPGPAGDPVADFLFVSNPLVTAKGPEDLVPRRIIVIGLDTTRRDHLGFYGYDRPTTPELDQIAAQSVIFDQAWTSAPRTRPSFRSATTGRWPLEAVSAENIGETFAKAGFATAGIVANMHLTTRFGFERGFDLWHLDTKARADDQVDRGLAWLTDHQDVDSYLFLHIMDPHIPYAPPERFVKAFQRHPEQKGIGRRFNRTDVEGWEKRGKLSEARMEAVVDLYDAEIAYTDEQLGRFFRGLDALPGRTLVVIHNDHGEEFWEHGQFEHNHSLYAELTRSVFVVRPPDRDGGGFRVDTPVSIVDIGSTLFDFAGLKDTPAQDGRSLIPLMRGQPDPAGPRPLQTSYNAYDRERWGVVHQDRHYVIWTASGLEELYDIREDLGETHDLAANSDLSGWRKALQDSHAGLTIGPGWRFRVDLFKSGPVTIQLPQAAERAGVVDPEADMMWRSNQPWGETPKHVAADVGEVSLSADRKTLTFTPGRMASGTFWVRFAGEVSAPPTFDRDGQGLPTELHEGRHRWLNGKQFIEAWPSQIVEPPAAEEVRMKVTEASGSETDLLRSLGYIEGPGTGGGDKPPEDEGSGGGAPDEGGTEGAHEEGPGHE
jgi:arylsulfatase A-like enzyme